MKIICIGRNYADHAKEMNSEVPSAPIFFMKPDSAILRQGNPFFIPNFTEEVHYECEVVVKINRVGKAIEERFAHKYYEEIGLGIDFTARDLQSKCKENRHPWEIAKAFDCSAAISSKFIPKKELDLNNFNFSLKCGESILQNGNTKDMIFSIDQLISYVSKFVTLKIGDLIYTGTPAGVGKVNIGDELFGYIGEKEMFSFKIK